MITLLRRTSLPLGAAGLRFLPLAGPASTPAIPAAKHHPHGPIGTARGIAPGGATPQP